MNPVRQLSQPPPVRNESPREETFNERLNAAQRKGEVPFCDAVSLSIGELDQQSAQIPLAFLIQIQEGSLLRLSVIRTHGPSRSDAAELRLRCAIYRRVQQDHSHIECYGQFVPVGDFFDRCLREEEERSSDVYNRTHLCRFYKAIDASTELEQFLDVLKPVSKADMAAGLRRSADRLE